MDIHTVYIFPFKGKKRAKREKLLNSMSSLILLIYSFSFFAGDRIQAAGKSNSLLSSFASVKTFVIEIMSLFSFRRRGQRSADLVFIVVFFSSCLKLLVTSYEQCTYQNDAISCFISGTYTVLHSLLSAKLVLHSLSNAKLTFFHQICEAKLLMKVLLAIIYNSFN